MRIFADISRLPDLGPEVDSVIIQVAPTPPVGSAPVPINGKFYVDLPEGVVPPPIDIGSRLLGAAPANIIPAIYDGLLAKFSKYNFIQYNVLLTSADVADLDLAATFPASAGPPPVSWATRAQVGRGAGPDAGLAPNSVAVLPQNNTTVPPRPGVLITDTIDISGDIPAGTTEFLVYWKIHEYTVTPDVMDYDGPSPGTNEAAIKQLFEVEQSPADFEVYLSANDGGGYSLVSRLVPCAVCDPGTKIRLAFVNKSTTKKYIASYALLY
jgi:hypothetical protein